MIKKEYIDNGQEFDFGRTSSNYARYRDIYPKEFYQEILDMGLCVKGQNVLDIGTGTGVLPRNLYKYGASFTGIDISENQINQARALAKKLRMDIDFQCLPAEQIKFPDRSFDVVTACQCFAYFEHKTIAHNIHRMLKPGGKFVVLYMGWLPFEDKIAGGSEELVLKYNPTWTGGGEERHSIPVPSVYDEYFCIEKEDVFDLHVPFTRESWNGRMKTCRGIEASLPEKEVEQFSLEHQQFLNKSAPDEFQVLHYAAVTSMKRKD